MAEVLLVVQGVLRKVLPLAAEEISSSWGLKQDLQILAEKLEMIQALLSDAESKDLTSRAVQLWIKKLQSVATEADDALDEYTYVLLQKKMEGSLDKVLHFFSPSNPVLFHVEMARKVKKINHSLDEVHKSASGMGLRAVEVINASVTLREIRQTDPFVDDSQIVGRKNDISEMRCLIEKVGGLHNLKGEVKIYGLENVGNGEEARRANLSAKVNIHNLELHWSTRTQEFNDTDILEGLKPHTHLKGLTMRNFEGSKFPSWMVTSEHSMLLWNLVKIRLDNCNKCKQIPTLGQLTNLKIVLIPKLHNVKWIGEDFYGSTNHGDNTNESAPIAFPALQEFTLSGMSTLIGWSHAILSFANVFPQLDRFVVEDCPELANLPDFKSLQSLRAVNHFHVIPGIFNLQSLQKMSITGCDKLSTLPVGLEACTSLEWLNIQFCPVLQPEGVQWLSGLKELEIGYFSDDLVNFPFPKISDVYSVSSNTNDHTQPPCSLKLYGWPRVQDLPTQLQHLLGLRVLTLWGFEGLEALPEWLGNLSSLQILELYHCKKLKYLPSLQAMENLVNLRVLEMFGCRLLNKRCTLGKRPEWHKDCSHSRCSG
ncbi:hypothetical protein HAX54_024498 [Datura stramonium]|uniref:Rx N-terminal domain-containing protein n=1 Tax=Datura stramonium TaxID=4076 RepID=A0ABS8UZL2_DATST|nr:hypothetical protein [Datura stramonium]